MVSEQFIEARQKLKEMTERPLDDVKPCVIMIDVGIGHESGARDGGGPETFCRMNGRT